MNTADNEARQHSLPRDELRDAAVSGARWMIVARFTAEILVFAASVVLARLISPTEFGHAAVALVVPLIGANLAFQGFGSVLVKSESPTDAHKTTATFLSLACGLALAIAVWATAPFWAEPIFGERTSELIRLASPAFAIASIGAVPRAYLQRRLDFKSMSRFEVIAAVVGAAVSIVCAIAGMEGEALIVGALVQVGVEAALMFVAARPPRPRLVRRAAREIAAFGVPASLAGLASTAQRNVDYVLLGALAPAATVGFYWRGFKLGAEYQKKISGIMLRLAFPLFSRARNYADLRALRARVVRTNTVLTFPLLALLILIAPAFVPWLYGPAWEPAVEPTQILAVSGMALAVMSGTGALALAQGHASTLLWFNVSFLVATGVAVFLAEPSGLVAICVAVAGVHVVLVAIAQVVIVKRFAGFPIRDIVDDVIPAAVSTAAMLAVGATLRASLEGLGQPLAEVVILVAVASGVYALVLRFAFASAWAEIANTLRRVIPRRPRGPNLAGRAESPVSP